MKARLQENLSRPAESIIHPGKGDFVAICVDVFRLTTYSIVFKKKSTEDLTASASHVSYRCTIARQVTHKTFLVPL